MHLHHRSFVIVSRQKQFLDFIKGLHGLLYKSIKFNGWYTFWNDFIVNSKRIFTIWIPHSDYDQYIRNRSIVWCICVWVIPRLALIQQYWGCVAYIYVCIFCQKEGRHILNAPLFQFHSIHDRTTNTIFFDKNHTPFITQASLGLWLFWFFLCITF